LDVKIITNNRGVKKTRLAKKLSVLIELAQPKKIEGTIYFLYFNSQSIILKNLDIPANAQAKAVDV
jgi:hypothetical protein